MVEGGELESEAVVGTTVSNIIPATWLIAKDEEGKENKGEKNNAKVE